MPHGGEKIELPPERCPAGHAIGPPVGGVTRMTVGWQHCRCDAVASSAAPGHRTYFCLKPGCPEPLLLRPACTGNPHGARAIHTRPDASS